MHFRSKAISIGAIIGIATVVAYAPWVLAASAGASGYRVVKTIPIDGAGRWDYDIVDSGGRRVYISHQTHVVVLDADSYAVVGDIPDTPGVHGIALAPELGRGFTSNGKANTVTIFNLKTLKTIGRVPSGGVNPDAIYYDAASKRVFACNGRTGNVEAINAAEGTVAGNIVVGGKLEFAAGDGKGHVYVNVEDKSQLAEIDAQTLKVLHRWPLTGCKEPSGLAMDKNSRRLFSVCGNKKMMVVDADSGKVVATPTIGEDPDAAGFDPGSQLVFSSNGESGTLTVLHEDAPDKYTFVETVPTLKYARTMAIDFKTHNIFLPMAEFGSVIPKGQDEPEMKPNTFGVLVVSKQ